MMGLMVWWRRPACRTAIAGVALTLSVMGPALSTAQAGTSLSAVRDLTATVRGDQATVSWRPPLTGRVARYEVEAHRNDHYNEAFPDFGTRIVGGSKTSMVWPDLPLNHTVYFTVTPIGPDRAHYASGAAGPYNSTGTVRPTNSHCRSGSPGYCVVVNSTDRLGEERRPGAGLVNGTVPRGNRWARQLHLKDWRIQANNASEYREASAIVPRRSIIEVLSDAWYGSTARTDHGQTYAADPWADWARYTALIAGQVRAAERKGQHPIWEIQNEPEKYPYAPTQPPTRALVETQFLKAYRAIKQVDPRARIIGPSIDWQYEGPAARWYIDMKTFIPFAAAHGMKLYAIAWHDNGDTHAQDPLVYAEMPEALRDEAEEVRELIAENPRIGSPKLFADENSSASGQFIPGFAAGYLAAEDQAGVDEANRSCWEPPGSRRPNACFDPNLGELLNSDGKPNANYWVMRDYSAMSGTRVASEVSDIDLSSLAVTDASGTTRVLLGRHQTCSQPTTGLRYCDGPPTLPAAVSTRVQVLVPAGATSAKVTSQAIPNSLSDMTRPPATARSTVHVKNGLATIRIPALGDGAAYFITVKPNTTTGRAPRSGDSVHTEVPAPRGAARATRLLAQAGSGQSTAILHGFAKPLVVLLTDQRGDPLADTEVTFTLGSTGHGKFGGKTTATVRTDGNGVATSPAIAAGLPAGRWAATAYVTSLGLVPGAPVASFSLTNTLT